MKEYKIKVNGNDYAVSINDTDDKIAKVSVNGTEYNVELETSISSITTKTPKIVQTRAVNSAESMPQVKASAPTQRPTAAAAGSGNALKSPLPGVILDIFVKEGDTVTVGQKLMVLEAMKMENNIESDYAGTVTKVTVSKGASVLEGDVLITIS